jgi:signal transduction histidine kinase
VVLTVDRNELARLVGQTVAVTDQLLQLLWVPGCFFGAGLLGLRLGTPRPVATGLLAVGVTHSLAFLGAQQSIDSSGTSAAWVHLASQCLFAAGFAALVWLAAAYPARRPSTLLMALVGALALLGPAIGAVSGPTPTVVQLDDDTVQRGPIVHLLPADVASVAVAPVLLLPVVAVVLFAVRYHRADLLTRQAMRWPLVGTGLVALFAVAGALLDSSNSGAATVAFLTAAPLLPLSLAFGPVRRRLLELSEDLGARVAELEESRHRLSIAAESERRRLEHDLHDGAQQELLALLAQIERARASTNTDARDDALAHAADLGRKAYETVRAVAHGLRPAALDDLGLTAAVHEAVRTFPLPVQVVADDLGPDQIPPEVESAALYVVSEGFANVLRHARATAVTLRITCSTGPLTVHLEDDGIGGADPRGAGLRGLRDRVEAAGGRVVVRSEPGRTVLQASF